MLALLRATSWKDLLERISPLYLWGFRGQSDATWPLESTLVRSAVQCGCLLDHLNHREYWMQRQFERRAFDYLDGQPLPTSKLDWLALMQHYGSPTRLLDFSHSFYVASFFAMESAQGDAAIWAVNYDLVGKNIAKLAGVETSKENIDQRNTRHAGFLEPYLCLDAAPNTPHSVVVPVEPDRLHRRLTMQQGFFLCPTNLLVPFEASLAATLNLDPNTSLALAEIGWDEFDQRRWEYGAVKIVLPRAIHKVAIEDLYQMNIGASTLFPGLDGFARSMRYYIRALGH
ncbi:MAG: FRG domain-containing protein [Betaproteobacteria bacterium]